MPTLGSRSIRLLVAAFALLVLGPGVARAGLVSGRWDPQFGAFLPGLNWQVRAQMLVPNACSALADGVYTTAFGACAGSRLDSVYLRMFDTGQDPNDFFTITGTVTATTSTYWGWCYTGSTEPHCYNFNVNFFTLSAVRVQAGQVVGFASSEEFAQSLYTFSGNDYTNPTTAGGNVFGLTLGTNGPVLRCLSCRQNLLDPFGPVDVFASTTDLSQFLITYTTDDTSSPKFTDTNGNALGARLDANGKYLGQSNAFDGAIIPEPASVVMVFTAFAALGFVRRRLTRRG